MNGACGDMTVKGPVIIIALIHKGWHPIIKVPILLDTLLNTNHLKKLQVTIVPCYMYYTSRHCSHFDTHNGEKYFAVKMSNR